MPYTFGISRDLDGGRRLRSLHPDSNNEWSAHSLGGAGEALHRWVLSLHIRCIAIKESISALNGLVKSALYTLKAN
jgi:hypothetical protein